MTATIHSLRDVRRLAPHAPVVAPEPLRHGPYAHMQAVSAARSHVRHLSRRLPLSDRGGDVWAQVGDVVALVTGVSAGHLELDSLAHAIKDTFCGTRRKGMDRRTISLSSATVEVVSTRRAARIRILADGEDRLVSFVLEADRARRVDDRTVSR